MERRDVLILPLAASAMLFASACGGAQGDESDLGTADSALLNGNSLNGNSLNGNSLNGNSLNGNSLNGNGLNGTALTALASVALTPSTIGGAAMAGLQDPTSIGDTARQLLKYTVSCAFDTTQSFSFSWVDSSSVTHNETYTGLLALATDWISGPLGSTGQGWVSACLISRVNYSGTVVMISARGPIGGLNVTDSTELGTYTMREGAFWGNLFTSTPYAVTCDDPTDDTYSRSLYRECAAGHLDGSGNVSDCPNIVRLGSCATLSCMSPASKSYYNRCTDPTHGTINQLVTVYLHD